MSATKTRTKKEDYDDSYNFEDSDYRTRKAISNRIDRILNVLEKQRVLCSPKDNVKVLASTVKRNILRNEPLLYPRIEACKSNEEYDVVLQECVKKAIEDASLKKTVNKTVKKTVPKKTVNKTAKSSPSPERSATPPQYKNEDGLYICDVCPNYGPTTSRKRFLNHLNTKGHKENVEKQKAREELANIESPEFWGCKHCKYEIKRDDNRKKMMNKYERHMASEHKRTVQQKKLPEKENSKSLLNLCYKKSKNRLVLQKHLQQKKYKK